MSESVRSSKSMKSTSSATSSSTIAGKHHLIGSISKTYNGGINGHNGTSTQKFNNIVNKVESLICKMNNDKVNNNFKLLQQETKRIAGNNSQYDCCCMMSATTTPTPKNTRKLTTKNNVACWSCESCMRYELHCQCNAAAKKLSKAASLDSLNNLTDVDSVEENPDVVYTTDTDEDTEVAHITGTTAVQVHHRRCDLDQLTDESIRVFNEQCNSMDHQNMDFENVWSTEEDDHQKFCNDINCRVGSSATAENQNNYKHSISNSGDSNSEISIHQQNQEDCNNNARAAAIGDNKCKINSNLNNNVGNALGSGSGSQLNCNINNVKSPRRSSVASSGSVGRMETIVEEPSENKISVKEILARFETMTMNETQSKASTISSGARAAAQILNVPIERLESRQSNHRESPIVSHVNGSANSGHMHSNDRGGSPMLVSNQEAAGVREHRSSAHQRSHHEISASEHTQQQHYRHQQQNYRHGSGETDEHTGESDSHIIDSHGDHIDRQQQQQHYQKQTSYLHSNRKISNGMTQQYQQQQHHHVHRDSREQMVSPPPSQNLDANYMSEDPNTVGTPPSVTKYSLLQFAMQHFRNDQLPESRATNHESTGDRSERRALSNRSYAELVKWQGTPIRMPLLRLPNDLAPLGLECFDCILRYCGDVPPDPELTEVKCVYTVLMHCHKYLALRDEVYCQLMKQTTANRSPCPDSAQRAWRLLSILAAYFGCSDALRPYLMEHLTSAASDRRRSCHGTASVCLTNLRKTARCGGRKNVPSVEEVTAVSAGRSARRQIYRLPGGAERVVNTRCSTVVADVIGELCALLGIDSEIEQQEFSLYCIVQGDAFTMPLAADEYILDVTTELLKSGQPFYLIFCRSVWHFPLKRDPAPTPLYIEVLFNQVAPDYLEGLLLELPGNGIPIPEVVRDMARIAAMLHRAADLTHVPAMKEIKFLLPKPALGIRELRPAQWVGLVQSAWPQIANLSPSQVKAQFLNVLSAWPLFGSSFFAVKRIWAEDGPNVEESNPMWRDLILALNRRGVLFLDPNTHETMQHWPFMEVISTRKVRSEDGALFLDMKVGNLMQQRVIRVQTEQAHEISRLVRQYITMAQISQRDKRELN